MMIAGELFQQVTPTDGLQLRLILASGAASMYDLIGFNLFLSIAAFIGSLIYMKYFLSANGFEINWLWGWDRDFSIVKKISKSSDSPLRGGARKLAYGIYFSVGYLIATGVCGVIFSK